MKWILISGCCFFALATLCRADLLGYSWDFNKNTFYLTNFTTTETTKLPLLNNNKNLQAFDVSPVDGSIYAMFSRYEMPDYSQAPGLYRIGPDNTAVQISRSIAGYVDIMSFAPDGTLYGISNWNNKLVKINTTTGLTSDVCSIYPYDLFIISPTGQAIGGIHETGYLFDVNLQTGAALPLGEMIKRDTNLWSGFDFAPDGKFYEFDANWVFREIQFNPLRRVDSIVYSMLSYMPTTGPDFAFVPTIIPEPASLLLLAIGGVLIRKR